MLRRPPHSPRWHTPENNLSLAPFIASGTPLKAADITVRELNVAIPANTTSAQWTEINRAIQYGQSKGVSVKITVVK